MLGKNSTGIVGHNDIMTAMIYTHVLNMRHTIEALFNWLIEKTDIQRASKVRSTKGLVVHVFGRIATANIFLIFNF